TRRSDVCRKHPSKGHAAAGRLETLWKCVRNAKLPLRKKVQPQAKVALGAYKYGCGEYLSLSGGLLHRFARRILLRGRSLNRLAFALIHGSQAVQTLLGVASAGERAEDIDHLLQPVGLVFLLSPEQLDERLKISVEDFELVVLSQLSHPRNSSAAEHSEVA